MSSMTASRSPSAHIPTAEERPTLRLDEVCGPLNMGRSAVYAAAASGDIPTIRIGRRILVPTAALRRMLQLDEPTTPTAA